MGDERSNIDAAFNERGRLVPRFVQLAAVDSFNRQLVEHDRVPINCRGGGHNSKQSDFAAVEHIRQNVVERFRIARHFERDVESFFHPELLHCVSEFLRSNIERQVDLHFPGELDTIRIDVSDDDVTRAGMFADRDRHATDRARAGDEDVFADEVERERSVNGVAHRIETGKHVERDRRIGVPAVRLRNGDELGPGAVAIHADAGCVRTKMTPAGETIAAMATGDVAFTDNEISLGKTFDMIAHALDHADELVPNGHRDGDGLLGPRIPVIYMYVGPADGGL